MQLPTSEPAAGMAALATHASTIATLASATASATVASALFVFSHRPVQHPVTAPRAGTVCAHFFERGHHVRLLVLHGLFVYALASGSAAPLQLPRVHSHGLRHQL